MNFDSFDKRMNLSYRDKIELLKYVKPGVIIDFGCGNGLITKKLSLAFSESKVYGVDFNLSLVKKAQSNCPDATILNIDYTSDFGLKKIFRTTGLADTILFFSTLHEVEGDAKMNRILEFCFNSLQDNGVIIYRDGIRPVLENKILTINSLSNDIALKAIKFSKDYIYRKIELESSNEEINAGIIKFSAFDMLDFLCKYYFEGELWARDMNESFGKYNIFQLLNFFGERFEFIYIHKYTPDYLLDRWKKDFDCEGDFITSHVAIVMKKMIR